MAPTPNAFNETMPAPVVAYKTIKEIPTKAADLNASSAPIVHRIAPVFVTSVKIHVLVSADQMLSAQPSTTCQPVTVYPATLVTHS